MKLWQKVFLIAAVLTTLSVFLTALGITAVNFHSDLQREQDSALQTFAYLSSDITNAAAYRRISSGRIRLPREEAEALLTETVRSFASETVRAGVYREDTLVAGEEMSLLTDADFRAGLNDSGQCVMEIAEQDGETYLFTGAQIAVEGDDYLLLTRTVLTDLYALYDSQLLFVRVASLVSAALVGLLLFFAVRSLLRPLDRVNRTLRRIAEGEYDIRLPLTGGAEIQEISGNVNRMAAAVEENVNRLSQIAESRKRFADSLAHEMKTPLTSIMGLADVMRIRRDLPDRERVEYADIIVHEARRLKELSSKLLELAGAEGGALDLQPLSVPALFDEVEQAAVPLLRRAEVTLAVSARNAQILADKELMKSLLLNLIDNAIKASGAGQQVSLCCRTEESKVILSVADHGIGISEKDLAKVTEPFYMADKSRSRKAGGAGLGLALCVEIVKLHRGVFSIKSKVGKGTTVTITLKGVDSTNETNA